MSVPTMKTLNQKQIRVLFCLLVISIQFYLTSPQVNGAKAQLPNGVWRVYLSHRIPIVTQQTPVWCWAASLSALFGAFGHPVDQRRIVATYFPPPGVTTGPPWVMRNALNAVWVDDNGKKFQVQSAITNLYPPQGPVQVNNSDIINALENEVPIFYGDTTHAMILVQADFIPTPNGPNILAGWAIDPFPGPTGQAYGFRQLQPNELRALFAAIPTVTDLN
jgi:hypothetical protein